MREDGTLMHVVFHDGEHAVSHTGAVFGIASSVDWDHDLKCVRAEMRTGGIITASSLGGQY